VPEAAFVATIGKVRIEGAAADFTDESLPLPFSARIEDMAGELSTIATNSAEPSTVALQGKVDEFGLVRVSGFMTPLDVPKNTDLKVIFENVEIPKFSAYTIPFAGREIASGRLDLDLGYQVRDSQLVGENKIVLRDFELGDEVPHPGAASLPLGLAVALLKDSAGNIDIDLPVSGDLDDPEFGYGRVIGQAVANLIIKIVACPFSLLVNLLGVEADELEYINFPVGRSDLAPPEIERANKLAEALALRPELRLELSGVVDRDGDGRALQTMKVDADIDARMAELEADSDAQFTERRQQTIESLYRQSVSADEVALDALRTQFVTAQADAETGRSEDVFDALAFTEELRRQLIDATAVDEAELVRLARERAENTQAAVIAVDPALQGRVTIVELQEEAPDRREDMVRMKVSLSAGN